MKLDQYTTNELLRAALAIATGDHDEDPSFGPLMSEIQTRLSKGTNQEGFEKAFELSREQLLEKGLISDVLISSYGPNANPITFTKTGKELKEKFPTIVASLNSKQRELEVQLLAIAAQVSVEPTEPFTSHTTSQQYLRYGYEQYEPKWDSMLNCCPERTEEQKLMVQYNSLSYMWSQLADDIAILTVMQNNLDDTKKYTLTASQLIALSF